MDIASPEQLSLLHLLNTPSCPRLNLSKVLGSSSLLSSRWQQLRFVHFLLKRGDIDSLDKLQRTCDFIRVNLCNIVTVDSVPGLEWFFGFNQDKLNPDNIWELTILACRTGALRIVEWCYTWYRARALTGEGRHNPAVFPSYAWSAAAERGQLRLLEWLHQYNIPMATLNGILASSLQGGDKTLRFIHKLGVVYDPEEGLHPSTIQFFVELLEQKVGAKGWLAVKTEYAFCFQWLRDNRITLVDEDDSECTILDRLREESLCGPRRKSDW